SGDVLYTCSILLFYVPLANGDLHSFPTRRSSDLMARSAGIVEQPLSVVARGEVRSVQPRIGRGHCRDPFLPVGGTNGPGGDWVRSEEHTSELQSRVDLVCRLLLEKKKELHYRTIH